MSTEQTQPQVVSADHVVQVFHIMKDDDGRILADTTAEGFEYLHGHNLLIPALEQALDGCKTDDEISITVEPEDAYGLHDPESVADIPRSRIENDEVELVPGNMIQTYGPEGRIEMLILEVSDDAVKVDLNHPLAGFRLHFEATVGVIRKAHPDEIKHRQVHPGGHHLMTADKAPDESA